MSIRAAKENLREHLKGSGLLAGDNVALGKGYGFDETDTDNRGRKPPVICIFTGRFSGYQDRKIRIERTVRLEVHYLLGSATSYPIDEEFDGVIDREAEAFESALFYWSSSYRDNGASSVLASVSIGQISNGEDINGLFVGIVGELSIDLIVADKPTSSKDYKGTSGNIKIRGGSKKKELQV